MQRKLNVLLLLFSLIGGAAGFLAGELLLAQLDHWPSIISIGLYFALVALGIMLGALIAEMTAPRLNGASWRQRYVGLSWKLLPLAVVLLLGFGFAAELVYELNFGGTKTVKDVVMVIDDSGSMEQNDPDNRRHAAARDLVMQMDKDNRVAVISFSDQAAVVQPLTKVKKEADRNQVIAAIEGLQTTTGGTNLDGALQEALGTLGGDDASRGAMVILLSDGASQLDPQQDLESYISRGIAVNTVGLSLQEPSGAELLRQIAGATGGQYYDVDDAGRLAEVFREIYDRLGDRTLVTERTDAAQNSPYYAAVRVLSLLLIGAALGVGLGIVFDNRHLAKSFGIGGAVAGLLSGLTLEYGLSGHPLGDSLVRLAAVLLLAGIIALFTLIIPVGEGRLTRRGSRGAPQPSADSTRRPRGGSSRGF